MSPSPEPQLAYLGFQLVAPSQWLRPYVREYWYLRRDIPLIAYHEEYMHPRGGFGVVFNFGEALRLDAQGLAEPVFLDGANTISRKLAFLGRVELLGVRFHEGGVYPFLGLPLAELRNETILLDALDRPGLLRLHARLREAGSLPVRINLLEGWLSGRLARGRQREPLIPASLTMLRERAGQLSIPELALAFSVGQRQLERLYQSQVGMSPKQYSQLVKVETARLALKQTSEQSTASLAVQLGFYDQSHFVREFSAVIGLTPHAYLKRNHERSESR